MSVESFDNFEGFDIIWYSIWANLMVMSCAVGKSLPLVVAVAQERFLALVTNEVGEKVLNIDVEFKASVE